VTDLSNSKRLDTLRGLSNPDGKHPQEGSNIVRRTSFSLPSLSDIEQTPFSISFDWRERDSTSTAIAPTFSIWEEVPVPGQGLSIASAAGLLSGPDIASASGLPSGPDIVSASGLVGVPGIVIASGLVGVSGIVSASGLVGVPGIVIASGLVDVPGIVSAAGLPNGPDRVSGAGLPSATGLPVPSVNTKAASLPSSLPVKKVRKNVFKIVTLLAILIFGTVFYTYYTDALTLDKISPPGSGPTSLIRQGNNVTPTIAQERNVTPTIAQAQGNRSFQVGAHAFIMINGSHSNVSIHSGDAGTVIVETNNTGDGQGSNDVQYSQSRDEQGNDHINIVTALQNKHVNYTVTVPSTTQVAVEVSSGSISVDGVSGVTITTTNGSIDIGDVNGPTNVSTQNGNVSIHNVKGQMAVGTINGSIKINDVTGQLNAVTQNGNVTVKQALLNGQSVLKTNYGSVSLTGSIDPNGTYTMETRSGNVNTLFPDNAAFQLSASTHSGSIHNEFGSNRVGNAPQAQVIVNIGSGSITIKKAV
jgi:hypothetical protein